MKLIIFEAALILNLPWEEHQSTVLLHIGVPWDMSLIEKVSNFIQEPFMLIW